MTSGMERVLRHGTTKARAEAILRDGPNPYFIEPGGIISDKGFSTSLAGGPITVGAPEDYARAKSLLFPDEGGPAILEMTVPLEIVELAIDAGGEIRFDLSGGGLDELIAVWPTLAKRVIVP
jgi:hypothetical protein